MGNSGDLGERRAIEFFEQHGLTCVRYTKDELRTGGQTPDFKVYKGDEFVLYAEAKHVQEDNWEGGLRNDPIFNRLSNRVHEAAKQFAAVNPDYKLPNVLVFTNSDRLCSVQDLKCVLTGNQEIDSGPPEPMFKNISEGRIRDEKHSIDLYVWNDVYLGADSRFIRIFARESKHLELLRSLLQTEPKQTL